MTTAIRVLYVDDEPDLLDISKLFLEESGEFIVTTAISADEGIHLLEQEKFDAIISDYQMPCMDGIQFLVEVRKRFGPIPFILFTGRGREEVVIQAINSGADFYLQKGGEPGAQFAELAHKVKTAASGKRADDALRQNVDDLSRAEQALRESEEKFHSLYLHMTEGAALHKLTYNEKGIPEDYIVIETNPAFERQLGISRDAVIGKTSREAYGLTVPPFLEIYASVALTGKPEIFETYFPPLAKHFSISAYCPGKGRFATIFKDITERKLAGEALKKSEERFRGIFDTITSGVATYEVINDGASGKDYIIKDFNKTALEIEGKKNDEVVGKSLFDLRPAIDDYGLIAVFKRVWETGVPAYFPQKVYVDEKYSNWYENRVFRLQSGEIVAVYDDITERKVAEETLRNREEYYRTILQTTKDGFWIIDAHSGRFIDVNETYCAMSGYAKAEILMMGINDIDSIEDPVKTQERIERILTNGSELFETRHRRKDGSLFDAEISVTYFPGEGGKFICFCRDITERKQAKEALAETNEYLNNLFDYANAPIIVWDPNFVITRFNHAFEDLTLISAQEIIGQRLDILFPKDSRDTSLLQIKKTLEGERWETVEIPILIKDGSVRTVLWNSANLLDHDGRIISTIAQGVDITERKRVEESLRESEERYNSLFTNNYSVSLLIDPDTGMIVDANAAACKYYGYSLEQIREMGIYEINRIVKERVIRNLKAAKKEKERHFFSTHFLSDGRQRNVEIYSGPILVNGKTLFYSIIHDITDRVKAEEELKNSRHFIEHTLSITPALIYIYDVVEQRNVYTNRGIFEALGYTSEEISAMGQDFFLKILHPDDAGPVGQHHARFSSLPDSTVAEIEYRMKHADGSWRWLHSRDVVFQRTPDGAVKQILGSSIDITDRKMAEEALRESESRMRDIISFLPDATLVIDKNGMVLAWNRAMEEMTGVPAEQMSGKANYEYALPFYHERRPITVDLVLHDDPAIVEKYPFMLKEGRSRRSEIFIPHLNKGRGAYLWFMASPLYDADGNLMGAIESIRDITDRKQAEDALRQANKKLKLLSGITRHDINNQLLVLNGFLGFLQRKVTDPTLKDYFTKITNTSTRIAAMIQFTREYECIGVKAPAWQDFCTLVDTSAKQAPLGNVILKNDLPVGAEVFADPLIVKVCYNLMDNAVRHGGKITIIRFSSEERDGDHLIVCKDDGIGVVADEKEQIFERGFGKNTGLGLALSREILSITGITICENGEPGKGARFEMTVPKGAWRSVRKDA